MTELEWCQSLREKIAAFNAVVAAQPALNEHSIAPLEAALRDLNIILYSGYAVYHGGKTWEGLKTKPLPSTFTLTLEDLLS
jgi:hypothetical protein